MADVELYKSLHSEDTTVIVDDINLGTLETIFINDRYNVSEIGLIVPGFRLFYLRGTKFK